MLLQGEPFSSMPRLRVLSMRNNRMSRIHEASFRNLRGNIAILDVDGKFEFKKNMNQKSNKIKLLSGNPIECSCEMLWLRAWLQETGGQFPGPRCRDGSMLRDLDLNRQNCNPPGDERSYNQIPLTNEHGDIFLRNNDLYDDCGPSGTGEGYEDFPPNNQYYSNNLPPSPVESEYFYDQYVDYPNNETHQNLTNTFPTNASNFNQYTDFNNNKFTQYQFPQNRPPTSQFTFFGMPIPSLSIGNLWGAGRTANNRASASSNAISGIGTRGKGRVQIYRPGDPQLQAIVNHNDIEDKKPQASSDRKQTIDTTEKNLNNFYRPYFQTPFSQPPSEKGFTPMIPGLTNGGFTPVSGPGNNNQNDSKYWEAEDRFQEQVPLVTENSKRPSGNVVDISKIQKRGPVVSTDNVVVRNHVTTSISPILSTLSPNYNGKQEQQEHEKTGDFTSKSEVVTEVPKSLSTLDEISKFENNMSKQLSEEKESQQQSEEAGIIQNINHNRNNNYNSFPKFNDKIIPTIEEEPDHEDVEIEETAEEEDDYNPLPGPSIPTYTNPQIYNQNSSSSLSALVAPGSIVTEQPPNNINRAPSIPKGKSTITKVFSPSPPSVVTPEVEIYPRGSPRPSYPSSFPSSTGYSEFDSEYQPNQIYTQTLNEKESYRTPQFEREDMEWYFKNYNRTDTPILNYNQQSLDINSFKSSSSKISLSLFTFLTGFLLIFLK